MNVLSAIILKDLLQSLFSFAASCETGYSCYLEECSIPGGPDDIVRALENPATKADPVISSIYDNTLRNYTCNEENAEKENFCCRDVGTPSVSSECNEYFNIITPSKR